MSGLAPLATERRTSKVGCFVPRHKVAAIGIGGASRLLPSHTTVRTGPYTAVREVTLTRFDQMIRRVSAGRSGSFAAESDSMSSPPACRASPVGADEKSRLNWISAACRSRVHVLLASFLVRAFSHRFRFGLSVVSAFLHGVPH